MDHLRPVAVRPRPIATRPASYLYCALYYVNSVERMSLAEACVVVFAVLLVVAGRSSTLAGRSSMLYLPNGERRFSAAVAAPTQVCVHIYYIFCYLFLLQMRPRVPFVSADATTADAYRRGSEPIRVKCTAHAINLVRNHYSTDVPLFKRLSRLFKELCALIHSLPHVN
jgi:hypothetical protein